MELFLYGSRICYFNIKRFLRLIVLYLFYFIQIMRIKRTARNFSNAFTKAFNDGRISIEEFKNKNKL